MGSDVLPVSAAVPPDELVAVSFADKSLGAGLFNPTGWDTSSPNQFVVTDDGGRRWTAVGATTSAISVQWVSRTVAYAWSASALLVTTDGARRRSSIEPPPGLDKGRAVVTFGQVGVIAGRVWVAFYCTTPAVSWRLCADFLWTWAPATGWRADTLPESASAATKGFIDEIAAGAPGQVLLLGSSLFVSDDAGATWSTDALPCGSLENHDPSPVAPTPRAESIVWAAGTLVLECDLPGGQGDGYQPMSFWALLPNRGQWALESDNLGAGWGMQPVGVAPDYGYATQLVASVGAIWLPTTRGGVYTSSDDGRLWSHVTGLGADVELVDGSLGFVSQEDGWCLYYPVGVAYTGDGGRTWGEP